MKTRSQKLISLVLVLMMLVSMIPMGIFTASAEGDVVEIANADDWTDAASTDLTGKTVKLTADISGITAPLADTFNGTFDGGNFTISNSTVTGAGVIANTLAGGATVQNVKFANVDVTSDSATGMIAGKLTGSDNAVFTLSKITVNSESSVKGTECVGGLIGHLDGTDYTLNVNNVSIEAAVTATSKCAGGLFGAEGDYVNGIAYNVSSGNANAIINVTDTVANATLSGSYNSAIIGYYTGNSTLNASSLNLTNVVAFGGTYAVGKMFYGSVNYENLFVKAQNIASASKYASWINGKTTNEVGVNASRESITVASIQSSGLLSAAPAIIVVADLAVMTPMDENGFVTFDEVTAKYLASPTVEIGSAIEWNVLAQKNYTFLGKTVVLTDDIDANNGELFTLSADFKGSFDGQGKTIKNATVNGAALIATAINTADGNVKNITFANVKFDNVTLTNTNGYAGLLAGSISGQRPAASDGPAVILATRIIVTNSSITGSNATGGLIGYTYIFSNRVAGSSITFDKIYVSATVKSTASHAGGFLGHDQSLGGGTVANGTHRVYVTVRDSISNCSVTDGGGNLRSSGMVGYYAGALATGTGVDPNTGLPGIAQCGPQAELVMENVAFGGSAEFCFGFVNNGPATYTNIYITNKDSSVFGFGGYYSWLNGNVTKFIGTTGTTQDCNRGSILMSEMEISEMELPTVLTAENVANMASTLSDKEGFLSFVPEKLQVVAVQRSIPVENETTYALRFIAPTYLADVTNVQMIVTATYEGGNRVFSTNSGAATDGSNPEITAPGAVMYDGLTIHSDYDIDSPSVLYASAFGAQKLAGFTIYNIPTNIEITFEAYMTYELNGTAVTSCTKTITFGVGGVAPQA